jgi:metallo-beta-lactamase family protein
MHLVGTRWHKILLDCGAHRGQRHNSPRPHGRFRFSPAELDAVILSHAHSDHCGNLPYLFRQGFAGPIYCTPATRDLIAVMLADSARIQEEDAHQHQVIWGAGDQAGFTREDVHRVVRQCVTLEYEAQKEILPGVLLRLADAGHILGSAMVTLMLDDAGRSHRLTFTGDLGRRGQPLVRDPSPIPSADLVICESTYGGRLHEPIEKLRETLGQTVRRTIDRGGKVLIPAFSLGRSQAVVQTMREEMRAGRLPELPIYVDSPLAAEVSAVYRNHRDILAAEDVNTANSNGDLLDGPFIHYVGDRDESRELSHRRDPSIIVASSGMCEGGRILQHLKNNIDDPRASIVLVSYQAPGTPGRQLLEHRPTVRFHGRKWNKWAEVIDLNGFSGHADQRDLLTLLSPLAGQVGKVCLVHGEPEQAEALAGALDRAGFGQVHIPAEGETVNIT